MVPRTIDVGGEAPPSPEEEGGAPTTRQNERAEGAPLNNRPHPHTISKVNPR